MFTLNKDRVIALWEPLPVLAGCQITRVQDCEFDRGSIVNPYPAILHRVIGCVAYDLARFADGGLILRPDHLVDLCASLAESPGRLRCTFQDGDREHIVANLPQRQAFRDLLSTCLGSSRPILAGEVRTPWNDDDLQLFGTMVLGILSQSQVRFL